MESLQRLAALPLVDNACASRANRDSWTYSVFCREVQAAEVDDPDALLLCIAQQGILVLQYPSSIRSYLKYVFSLHQ